MSQNAENLANEIEEVLNKWDVRDKIYNATKNNAQNINKY